MNEVLLPCPFCGSEYPYIVLQDVGGVVQCGSCSARTASHFTDHAVRDWNTRVKEE